MTLNSLFFIYLPFFLIYLLTSGQTCLPCGANRIETTEFPWLLRVPTVRKSAELLELADTQNVYLTC